MNIPEVINISVVSFPTYYLGIFFAFLVTLFFIWFESIRDGFDIDKVLDLFFLSLVILGVSYYVVNYYSLANRFLIDNKYLVVIYLGFFGTLLVIKYFTKRWKWSLYRVLDIFSIYFFAMALLVFGRKIMAENDYKLLFYLAVFFLSYLLTYFNRNRLFSGLLFSVLLLLVSIFGQVFYSSKSYLIFYFILITISMVNLVFRTRKKKVSMKINFDFISKIKDKLLLKDRRLKAEQKKLVEEDPYLQEGRDVGNAEVIDEAILEDRAKVELDIKKENISAMQKQVGKALGKIEKGEYGVCDNCGNPIDKARIEAYPEATTCMNCAKNAT